MTRRGVSGIGWVGWLSWTGLACLALVLGLGVAGQASDLRDRLERLRAEIAVHQAEALKFQTSAAGLAETARGLEQELEQIRRATAGGGELSTARGSLEQAESGLAQARQRLASRLVAIYKFSSTGGLPALYSARDFRTVIRLGEDLARIVQGDVLAFTRLREAGETRDQREERLRNLESELALRETARAQELADRRDEQAAALSRGEREVRLAKQLRELEKSLVARAERGDRSLGPGLQRGRVPLPVEGRISKRFGVEFDPELPIRLRSLGLEFASDLGATVRAVQKGRVLFAGPVAGYGQVVIVDHGGGSVTVSGYLEKVAVRADELLEAGEALGSAGEAASLDGPGLFFALSRDGAFVDPGPWFR